MSEDSLVNNNKPAWKRPENWVTWLGVAAVGYAALRGLDVILPLLNRVLENLLYTSVLAGGLAVVGFLVFNKDVHKLAWYGYKMLMKKITGIFINIDPIAILETYVSELESKFQHIVQSLASLKKQKQKMQESIREKTEAHEMSMKMMAKARESKDASMKMEMKLQSRKAGRLEKSTLTYQGLLNKLNQHIALTEKIKEASAFMIEDIKDTVAEEKEKRATIKESYKAMAASRRILLAGKDQEMYDMALENIKDDYFQKLGEIEQFMEDSQSFINGMDLQNGVYEEDALTKLNEWEQRSAALLEGGSGKTKYRVNAPNTSSSDNDSDEVVEEEQQQRQSYADLFK